MPDLQPDLHVQRVGSSEYIARNGRGAELRTGGSAVEGAFTPGELLQLALASCTLLAADRTLARRLGEDFPARIDVSATKTDDGDRYDTMVVDVILHLADLEVDKRTEVIERATKAIDRLCTIGHSFEHPIKYEVRIPDRP